MGTSIRTQGIAGLALGIALFSQIALGQKPGAPTGGGNNSGTTNRTPPGLPNRTDQTAGGSQNGNIYVSGMVQLDDGNPPPEPVTIERVCNGAPRAQGYTDQKGRFSFQLGETSGVLQDASEDGSNNPGQTHSLPTGIGAGTGQAPQMNAPSTHYENCELRALLAGFRSDTILLAGRRLLDDPNVGTLVLHRLANVEGTAISVTSLEAPKAAIRAYEKAAQNLRKGNLPDAADEYLKAVKIYPKYAAAWYGLGMIQARNQDVERARQSLMKAIEADTKFVSPFVPLIEMAAIAENWPELSDFTDRLIKLDPVDYPMAYLYNATANLNLHRNDAAEKSARAGEKLDTAHRYPKLEEVLAVILIRRKDYTGAAEHLRTYLLYAPDADDAPRMKKELAQLDRASGANQQAEAANPGKDGAREGGGQPGPQ